MVRIAVLRPLRLAAVNAMTRMDGLRPVIDSLGVIVAMYGFGDTEICRLCRLRPVPPARCGSSRRRSPA